jgi:hypothetical protein
LAVEVTVLCDYREVDADAGEPGDRRQRERAEGEQPDLVGRQ